MIDCSNMEQLTTCLRYVIGSLKPIEKFIGLHQVNNIRSETQVNAIKADALTCVTLRIEDCCGQCYDGASSMAGSRPVFLQPFEKRHLNLLYSRTAMDVHCNLPFVTS